MILQLDFGFAILGTKGLVAEMKTLFSLMLRSNGFFLIVSKLRDLLLECWHSCSGHTAPAVLASTVWNRILMQNILLKHFQMCGSSTVASDAMLRQFVLKCL